MSEERARAHLLLRLVLALLLLGRAVEHVLRVAEAVLPRLELAAELGRVLEVLEGDAAVLARVADRARVRRVAVRRQHGTRVLERTSNVQRRLFESPKSEIILSELRLSIILNSLILVEFQ